MEGQWYIVHYGSLECVEIGHKMSGSFLPESFADYFTHNPRHLDGVGADFFVTLMSCWWWDDWSRQPKMRPYLEAFGYRLYDWCGSKEWNVMLEECKGGKDSFLLGCKLVDTRYMDTQSMARIGRVFDGRRWE